MSEEKIPIVNVMEEIVDVKADSVMDATDMCRCPRCRADVKALALNNLPTKYVASEGGNVFMHMQTTTTQMQAEIMVAIVEAVSKVKYKPSHALDKGGKLKKVKEKRFSVYGKGAGEVPEGTAQMESPQNAEPAKISEEDIVSGEEKQPAAKISEEDIGGVSKEAAMAAALAAAKAKAEGTDGVNAAQDKEAAMAAALAAARAKAEAPIEEPEDQGLADSAGYGAFDATKLSGM